MTKEKKGFMDVYKKRYDPATEGFGSPSQWKDSFNKRMSLDEANTIVKEDDPFTILGVTRSSTMDAIKKMFRKLALVNHPDKNPGNEIEANEKMRKIIAAYTIIKNILKK